MALYENIPDNYPFGCTDEEIKKHISYLAKSFASTPNATVGMTSAVLTMLGQNELQNRFIHGVIAYATEISDTMRKISAQNAKTAIKYARFSIAIGVAAVLASASALVVSCTSHRSSTQWMKEQLPLLQELNRNQVQQTKQIEKLNEVLTTMNQKAQPANVSIPRRLKKR